MQHKTLAWEKVEIRILERWVTFTLHLSFDMGVQSNFRLTLTLNVQLPHPISTSFKVGITILFHSVSQYHIYPIFPYRCVPAGSIEVMDIYWIKYSNIWLWFDLISSRGNIIFYINFKHKFSLTYCVSLGCSLDLKIQFCGLEQHLYWLTHSRDSSTSEANWRQYT